MCYSTVSSVHHLNFGVMDSPQTRPLRSYLMSFIDNNSMRLFRCWKYFPMNDNAILIPRSRGGWRPGDTTSKGIGRHSTQPAFSVYSGMAQQGWNVSLRNVRIIHYNLSSLHVFEFAYPGAILVTCNQPMMPQTKVAKLLRNGFPRIWLFFAKSVTFIGSRMYSMVTTIYGL